MSTSYHLRCVEDDSTSASATHCVDFLRQVLAARAQIDALAVTPLWGELRIFHDWMFFDGWDEDGQTFPVDFVASHPGKTLVIEDEYGREVTE